MVFSKKKQKDLPILPSTAPHSTTQSGSGNRQNQGSDIEDLIVSRPATYPRTGGEKGMAVQGASVALGNAAVGGKTHSGKWETE
jgi:hypothetical protein